MELAYGLVNSVGRGVLRSLAVDVRTHGLEHLPRRGPVILASTHGSYLDFVVLEKAAIQRDRYVRFMTRSDAWVPPLLSFAMDRMRHIPVDRAAPAGAYLTGLQRLRDDEAVGVFPEAGISFSFTVRALMPGVAALARETGAPVVPVAMWGAQRIATVGAPHPAPDPTRRRVVDVAMGPPLHAAPGDDLTAWTRVLGSTLTRMLEELQRLPRHRPRPGEHAAWYPAHLGGRAPTRAQSVGLETVPLNAVPPSWGTEPDAPGRSSRDPASAADG